MKKEDDGALDELAQKILGNAQGQLLDLGVYRPEDKHHLETFAYYKSKWIGISKEIGDQFTIPGRSGEVDVKNPLITIQKSYFDAYMLALDKMGIGVVARAKLNIEPPDEEDDPNNPFKL